MQAHTADLYFFKCNLEMSSVDRCCCVVGFRLQRHTHTHTETVPTTDVTVCVGTRNKEEEEEEEEGETTESNCFLPHCFKGLLRFLALSFTV